MAYKKMLNVNTKADKILIFSDTHLSTIFDKPKYDYLVKIIKKAQIVLIAGDFWDSWFCTFDKFIRSEWNKLFPLLLSKQAIYIYGNHDPYNNCDARVNLFCRKSCEICILNKKYQIEHGHILAKKNEILFLKLYGKFLSSTKILKMHKIIYRLLHIGEKILVFFLGNNIILNNNFAKNNNLLLKKLVSDKFLICGNTHFPEIDNNNNFANSGVILYGIASYLTINNERLKLIIENYK